MSINSAIMWRIVSLQAVMVVVLVGAAIFAFGLGTFTTTQIREELTAQQIYFPTADQIKAGGALDPAKFPQEIKDQTGNQLDDGNHARIYANDLLADDLIGDASSPTHATIGSKRSAHNPRLAPAPNPHP